MCSSDLVMILMQPFAVLRIPAAPSRIPPAKCGRFHSLRYRIEMAEKDLGTLSQALLRKLLKKFSKNFQNFNTIGFRIFSLLSTDFGAAVFRAAISGCYEPNPVQRDLDGCRFSPLPGENGREVR